VQLRNCSRCGKIFAYVSKRICPDCLQEIEQDFERIRVYVKANPGATVAEIANELEVDPELIMEFVRQGRSDVVVNGLALQCERCGEDVIMGRYCEKCRQELDKELRGSVVSPEAPATATERDKQRMYTFDLRDEKRK
jgi:flagellar operon protein (TIGR03826 family)